MLLLGLVLATGLAVAGDLPSLEHGSQRVDRIVAGDLELADDDEGPADGVSQTFVAEDMAPGDGYVSQLVLLRDEASGTSPVVEPHLSVELVLDQRPLLAHTLEIDRLSYGDRDLLDEARGICGAPLTVAGLEACAGSAGYPLQELGDPTPKGRSLTLGVAFPETASPEVQGQGFTFAVEAELYAQPVPSPEELEELASIDRGCPQADTTPARSVPWTLGEGQAMDVRLLEGSSVREAGLIDVLVQAQLPSAC